MNLGAFSISLTVKDLAASRDFYAKLGFEPIGGDESHNYLILRNGDCLIGLFQGMFDRNILTFNPGWTAQQETLAEFTDVRTIQDTLRSRGIAIKTETDPDGRGPGSIALLDPDGNPVLIDQHVPAPE